MMKYADSNCVRILAPTNLAPQPPYSFHPNEHIGHVSRDVASVMSEVMDNENLRLDECGTYGVDFMFVCRLREDTNHAVEGYAFDIVVFSINSDSWTNLMIDNDRDSE